jgi:hypothetical protein
MLAARRAARALTAAALGPTAGPAAAGLPAAAAAARAFALVPMVIESSPRGERAFDIYSRLLRER